MKMRLQTQCRNCAAYYRNWTDNVEEEMNELAPGEDCSQGQPTWKTSKCPGWVGCDED